MISASVFDSTFLVTTVWQTTLALGVSAFLYLLWRHHPGRAHFCITLGLVASVALPITSQAVRHTGWGLLPTVPIPATPPAPPPTHNPGPSPESAPSPVLHAVSQSVFPWISVLWFSGSALLGLRFLLSLGAGIRLLAAARPLVNERLNALLESAMALLNVRHIPISFTTDAVRCPAIWCWAIHPAILLPASIVSNSVHWNEHQWVNIFSHELAHFKRRDHFAAIIAEVICVLFWWHPLTWWSRARMNELSDEACDRWVVASGQASDVYAETLLGMIPQRRSLTALSMATSQYGIKQRVSAILEASPSPAITGRWWTISYTMAALFLVVLVACMQTESTRKKSENKQVAALVIVNPGMETGDNEPASWTRGAAVEGVEYIWDRAVSKSGHASLCLRKSAQRYFPIAQWMQPLSITAADHPQTFRLSAWVKAEQAYKAILDLQYNTPQDEWQHKWAAYIGAKDNGTPPANHDWKLYRGEIEVPAGTTKLTIGLQIYGPGTVWFDDIELVPVESPNNPVPKP